MWKKVAATAAAVLLAASLAACGTLSSDKAGSTEDNGTQSNENSTAKDGSTVVTNLDKIDMTKWQYNSDDDVYYQIGISYCETPADENHETLSIFVPGAYMTGEDNGDGTYSCEINTSGTVGQYTAQTAPVVMPIDTPGYMAQEALTEYTSFAEYMDAGLIYVHAGCRGRDAGAPAGVTDIKAAIRYLRYTQDVIAGDTEHIFVFGMSGGGAQSALVGATGDSDLYEPYLEQIGAISGVSDAVYGSMDWCPITNLDTADEAYEWMMGVTRSDLSEEEQQISDALAEAFAEYINQAGIQDADGNVLTLEASEDGIYQSGSYYDYIMGVIEESLNNFLSDTEFPYDSSASGGEEEFGAGGRDAGGRGQQRAGRPDNGDATPGDRDNINRTETTGGITLSSTYETVEDYIDALNADGTWVAYDADSNTASITSVADFVKAFKNVSKSLGAFDQLDAGQGENVLFGYGDGDGAHFDSILSGILTDIGSSYASAYTEDLQKTDSAGYTVEQRLDMYTPLYYLLESEDGYGTSTVAKCWRIRSGIAQSDTLLTTEVNLALALQNYDDVESVDFAAVWGKQHVKAERTGDSTTNFIQWVGECMNEG